jgi:hypothetical protein
LFLVSSEARFVLNDWELSADSLNAYIFLSYWLKHDITYFSGMFLPSLIILVYCMHHCHGFDVID